MAFVVAFSVKQSADGTTVTLTDTTNYGDGGSFNKTDFTSRTLYITRGDTLIEEIILFPYTNTNNAIQDEYAWTIDQDYVYSIKMVLVDNMSVTYTFSSQVITSEFTNKKLREILSAYSTCGCDDNCKLAEKMQCGIDAATARTCAGDISQAQQIMSYVNELADNHINC
jgi:hypothetical protein